MAIARYEGKSPVPSYNPTLLRDPSACNLPRRKNNEPMSTHHCCRVVRYQPGWSYEAWLTKVSQHIYNVDIHIYICTCIM